MPKLYIIAIGFDVEAISKTIFQSASDKVCLLSTKHKPDEWRKDSDARTQEVEQEILEKLSGLIEVDVVRFNWGSYEDMIATVSDYIKEHRDWDITINLSFGSNRLTPILLMLSSLHGLSLEYTRLNELRPDLLQGDWHTGVHSIEKMPTLPLNVRLNEKELRFLSLVREHERLTVHDYVNAIDGEEPRLRSEFNYYVKKLAEEGYLITEDEGKRHVVRLSPAGSLVLQLQMA